MTNPENNQIKQHTKKYKVKLISVDTIQQFIYGSGWAIISPVCNYYQA